MSPTAAGGVGRVADVRMTDTGVEADLSLSSDVPIPADVTARVHSRSAIGEQYVELTPLAEARGAALRDGDVIAADRTGIPVDINTILDETNRGLTAIPAENLRTVIDESALAFGGLGPDLARLVRASTKLASGAKTDLGALTTVIDESAPVLDTQNDTADEIRSWAARLAGVTGQLAERDASVRNLLPDGAAAAGRSANCSSGCNRPCRSCSPIWLGLASWRSPTRPAYVRSWCWYPRPLPSWGVRWCPVWAS